MKLIQLSSVFVVSIFFLSFVPSDKSKADEPKGYAIIVSVPKVNNPMIRIKYGMPAEDSYADLPGACMDGERINDILTKQGFEDSNIIRIGKNANDKITEADITDAFHKIAKKIKSNDLFVFYYSGHGTSVNDQPGGDEADGKDEVFVTYNSYMLDDKINEIYKKSFSTTRNIMIVDACHGGSMFEIFKKKSLSFVDNSRFEKQNAKEASSDCSISYTIDEKVGFNMLYFGASRDENDGYETGNGGYFTVALKGIYHPVYWKDIKANELACKISIQMKANGDPGNGEIKYTECGALSDDFKNSHLFKIK